jgi:V8-like Glu-specific endopeptidase
MKSKLFRYTSLILGILLLLGLFLGALTSQAAAVTRADTLAKDDSGGTISTKDVPGWKAATRPWTKEEMLAAKPYPLPTSKADRSGVTNAPEVQVGDPGFKPSSLPMNARPMADVDADLGVFSAPSPLGYSYPAPFTRYTNFDTYTRFPYVTIGKLFFTQYGINYVCSASSIGNYAMWTAGHCIHAGDNSSSGWSYNVVFVPAYSNGAAPRGQWTAYTLTTMTAWYTSADFRYDMAGAAMYTNGSGYKLSQVVGNLGFTYNISRNLHWFQVGYPAASPFAGRYMIINASSYAYDDTSMGTPYPIGVGDDMTGGSSGGPWIYTFRGNAGATNYLNGNVSYRYSGYPLEMFSPYFGNGANTLWTDLLNDTAP